MVEPSENSALAANQTQRIRKSGRGRGLSRLGKCHVCTKPGHWARECPDKKKNASGKSSHNQPKGDALVVETLATSTEQEDYELVWCLDSGASDHMFIQRSWFIDLQTLEEEIPVRIGDGKFISATGKGDINVLAFDGRSWNEKNLSNVLFVPQLKYNLFSVGTALDKGLKLQSDDKKCELKKDGKTILTRKRYGKLFRMNLKIVAKENMVEANAAVVMFRDWHERLVHQNARYVKDFSKKTKKKR